MEKSYAQKKRDDRERDEQAMALVGEAIQLLAQALVTTRHYQAVGHLTEALEFARHAQVDLARAIE